jgi:uncharacterized protein (TIGR02271 family)
MIGVEHIHRLSGRELHDRDGNKIGTVGQIWDDGNGRPGWASVRTGLFGLNESLVPLNDAELRDEQVVVPYDKSKVKDAPNVDASKDEPLNPDEVDRLYRHYGMNWDDSSRAYGAGAAATEAGYRGPASTDAGYDSTTGTDAGSNSDGTETGYNSAAGGDAGYDRTAGPDAGYDSSEGAARGGDRGAASDGMTRSEERLNVGTQREQVGRARLRKYVVTEHEQVDVPVQREEVRLEREPITDANRDAAYSGPDIAESEHEVTLHAERPVVETEAVPVERVRLGKETVTGQQTVGGDVRKERVEADLPDEDGRRSLD